MKRVSLLMCLVASLFVAPLLAQPVDTGPPDVRVMLKPQQQGQPRTIVVGPRAAGVCIASPDCPDRFTVMWVGNKNEGETIQIDFITPASGDCFHPISLTLDALGDPGKKTVQVQNSALCRLKGKTAFFYEVRCVGGEGGDCGGVLKVDPGGMVDR